MTERSPAQRELLRFVLTVLALEVIAIGIFYAADIESASGRARQTYMLVWTAVSLAVVLNGLGRIRRARSGGRRTPRN